MSEDKKTKLTLIGGTGASIIGNKAKDDADLDVCLLVSLVDDGGSTGKLRKQLNILPVGDIRKALSSLSQLPESAIKAFEYRFENGDLRGHVMGNIFLAGLISENHDANKAIKSAQKMMSTKGRVLTTTLEKTELNTEFKNGNNIKTLKGENSLDENRDASLGDPINYFFTQNEPANLAAVKAIEEADLIVLGPGDLGANTVAPILTEGIGSAIKKSLGKLIYVGNLMTKHGETGNLSVNDCAYFIEKYTNRKIDYVLLNNTPVPSPMLEAYKKEGEEPMSYSEKEFEEKGIKVIKADLLDPCAYQKSKADKLRRSALRHDGEKTTQALKNIIAP